MDGTRAPGFERFAGWLSILAGVAGIGYAVAFVVLKDAGLSGLFLLLAPLLATAGLVAVFERVRGVDSGFATFGLTGVSVAILAWLAGRTPELPGWVRPVGLLLGVVLVVTWLARLIVLDATSPLVLGPALVAGLLSPLFFLGLGVWLLGWRR